MVSNFDPKGVGFNVPIELLQAQAIMGRYISKAPLAGQILVVVLKGEPMQTIGRLKNEALLLKVNSVSFVQ